MKTLIEKDTGKFEPKYELYPEGEEQLAIAVLRKAFKDAYNNRGVTKYDKETAITFLSQPNNEALQFFAAILRVKPERITDIYKTHKEKNLSRNLHAYLLNKKHETATTSPA